jgi:hypothetical protein
MMRLHLGAGVIVAWEPDCSPQVKIAVTTPEHQIALFRALLTLYGFLSLHLQRCIAILGCMSPSNSR